MSDRTHAESAFDDGIYQELLKTLKEYPQLTDMLLRLTQANEREQRPVTAEEIRARPADLGVVVDAVNDRFAWRGHGNPRGDGMISIVTVSEQNTQAFFVEEPLRQNLLTHGREQEARLAAQVTQEQERIEALTSGVPASKTPKPPSQG